MGIPLISKFSLYDGYTKGANVPPRVEICTLILLADKSIIISLFFYVPLVMQFCPTMLTPSLMIIVEPKKSSARKQTLMR